MAKSSGDNGLWVTLKYAAAVMGCSYENVNQNWTKKLGEFWKPGKRGGAAGKLYLPKLWQVAIDEATSTSEDIKRKKDLLDIDERKVRIQQRQHRLDKDRSNYITRSQFVTTLGVIRKHLEREAKLGNKGDLRRALRDIDRDVGTGEADV